MSEGRPRWCVCRWCGSFRGVLKGILVCPKCDYDHDRATVIPNEHLVKDAR